METIGKKIAEIRKQKGLTQEEVSEQAKINLRTLQRIEKGETEPRGNSLKGICDALHINIEDIVDYGKFEDKNYLMYLHLSVIVFPVIPFGNIILPLILWLNKRDKIMQVQKQGANILNYQIFWTIITNVLFISYVLIKITHMFSVWPLKNPNLIMYIFFFICSINFIYPIVIAIKINRGQVKNFYPAAFRFIK
ncbi:helix-turn-helix domain-containing protein [Flavobacterium sp. DG1-102-2]|uniref:helix-turn-helix domain-containing protein n=1 Tax=Flavobacterium sp. DG1-102-2 TaxID=3081663 RepID=UPI002949EEFD|nr:helix-turn-helix domain-containing protein [Flavobacterium sp. DG1-102-2]MDV6167741.1 helix-turn-helix domain-containing protein [Flavobacterium sp. DG1-102-2]